MPDALNIIFISYAHADTAFVDRLEADLRQQGLNPWVDRHSLAGGYKWRRALQEAIDRCRVVLVVLSPEAVASEYVQAEYGYSLEEGKLVIPLYYRSCKVPLELRSIQWIDFQHSYEQGLAALVPALAGQGGTTTPTVASANTGERALSPPHRSNRQLLLSRVRSFWIRGVLEHSLHGAALIALGFREQDNAVANPWQLALQQVSASPRPLPAGTSITQVYDEADGELLILGAPGSGKTTLLLELARVLLERAERDERHPMPVVFTLSSWAEKHAPLQDWLIEELHAKYQVPRSLSKQWIEAEQVLPLLDGLDEVVAAQRTDCAEAINAYRQEHGFLPLVVSSRSADYLAQTPRLLLRKAVVVQPLSTQQIEDYLQRGGEALSALRAALHQDAALRELTTTPLMLSILTLTYHDLPMETLLGSGVPTTRQQVLEHYVQRMLTHRSTHTDYSPQQMIRWLTWLARQMKQRSQTVFYLERMQPDWLSGTWILRAYDCLAVGLPAILLGVLVSLVIQLLFFSLPDLFKLVEWILLGGLLGGILSEASAAQRPAVSPVQTRSTLWSRLLPQLGAAIFVGLGIGLIHGTMREATHDPTHGLRYGLSHLPTSGLVHGLVYGLIFGLCSLLLQLLLGKDAAAESALQTPSSAWKMRWKPLIRSTPGRNGLLIGMLVGLAYGLSRALTYTLSYGLSRGLLYGLAYGLIGGLLSVLMARRSAGIQLADRLAWSWRKLFSRRLVNATLWIIALIGLLDGLSVGLTYGLGRGLINGLVTALGIGPSVGLTYGLLLGLFQGVSSETIEDQHRVVPNEGIRRSARNGLLLGVVTTILLGLSGIIGYELIYGLSTALGIIPSVGLNTALVVGLGSGLSIGLSAGLLAGLLNGGLACLRHWVLRFLLWCAESIPWTCPHFLYVAAERILLCKVGGGYMFVHRLLLGYFANRETGAGSAASAESRQERLPSDTAPSAPMEPTRVDPFPDVPTAPLAPTPVVCEVPRLLPCGHEWRPNARFCGVCGAAVPS